MLPLLSTASACGTVQRSAENTLLSDVIHDVQHEIP